MDWFIKLFSDTSRDTTEACCHLDDYYEHQFRLQPAKAKPLPKATARQYLQRWFG
jgi:hypothetical protein